MSEIKITINAPELTEAIKNLAKAIANTQCGCTVNNAGTLNADMTESIPTAEATPTPVAPATTPNPTVPTSAPQVAPVVPVVPTVTTPTPDVAPTPQYTLDMIARAGTALVDAGKVAEVSALLGKYNVEVLTALDPSMYASVAADLRAMGAPI